MQSFFQYRQIYKELEKQIVVERDPPDNIRTHERRYWYRNNEIRSEPYDPNGGAPAERRRTHGHHTVVGGPTLEPRHTARSHLERNGDLERADLDPDVQADPYTINTRDSIGASVDMMVTGVERQRPANEGPDNVSDGAPNGVPDTGDSPQDKKLIMVSYEGDCDPMDPHNWPLLRRLWCTALMSLLGAVTFGSTTIDASALASLRATYHTSFELQTVPTALYLIGLGVGGLFTAPISEVLGRNPVYLTMLPGFMLFDMGAGLAQNIGQRCVCRGLAGLFGSAPLVCSAAAVVDVWSLEERVYIFPVTIIIVFLGALLAIVPGSYIGQQSLKNNWVSWRWVDWATIIFAGIVLALVVLSMPETYGPVLLRWKAKQLRRLTGDNRFRAPLEFKRVSFPRRLGHALGRPILLFWTEPIIMILASYHAIIFIILYTFSAGSIAIFAEQHGLSHGETGLTFIALAVGAALAGLFVPLAASLIRRYIYRTRSRRPHRPEPELNLYLAMFGAPMLPVSMFWMGWTARPSISIWCPLAGAVLFGCGVLCVVVSSFMYVAATFEHHPASALATLQLLRLVAAGVMAILAHIMYTRLDAHWSATLLGCIATIFLPVPYVLFQWGNRVRKWSHYAQSSFD